MPPPGRANARPSLIAEELFAVVYVGTRVEIVR
jgi:hypothetical protein